MIDGARKQRASTRPEHRAKRLLAYPHPADHYDRAGRRGNVPCKVCGLALREHSPHFPHDSRGCNGFEADARKLVPHEPPIAKKLAPLPLLFPRLDRTVVPQDDPPQLKRAKLLDALRAFSRPRTANCRSKRCAPAVQLHRVGERVALQGIETCGSVWACPCCAARIFAERATEIKKALDGWTSFEPAMVTLTIRHGSFDSLGRLRKGLTRAWERLWRGRGGMKRRKSWRVNHWIRAVEVSHGKHGWHPHIHAIVFTARPLNDDDRRELAHAWRRAVVAELGFRQRPSIKRGSHIGPSRGPKYLAKLGLEIHAITKLGRAEGHRSPWQIAQDAAAGDRASAKLWQSYARAMHGARQLTWSRGAKQRFGIDEKDDDELAKEPIIKGLLATWEGPSWDRARRSPFWLSRVMGAASSSLPMTELGKLPGVTSTGPPGIVDRPDDANTGPPPLPGFERDDRRACTSAEAADRSELRARGS